MGAVDGVLYQMAAAPNLKHQDVSRNLIVRIEPHISRRRPGVLYHAPTALLLPGETAVEPDLFYVRSSGLTFLPSGPARGRPIW